MTKTRLLQLMTKGGDRCESRWKFPVLLYIMIYNNLYIIYIYILVDSNIFVTVTWVMPSNCLRNCTVSTLTLSNIYSWPVGRLTSMVVRRCGWVNVTRVTGIGAWCLPPLQGTHLCVICEQAPGNVPHVITERWRNQGKCVWIFMRTSAAGACTL